MLSSNSFLSSTSAMTSSENTPAPAGTEYVPPKVWNADPDLGGTFGSNLPRAGSRFDKNVSVGTHSLQLYATGTPNGHKVTMMLEELLEAGAPAEYDAWKIGISGDQFGSGFVDINPNSKIPAMVDHSMSPPLRIFESGSIMIYLAEKYGMLLPKDLAKRTECMNWLFWQMGSAPYLSGGFGHFYAYAPTKKIEYAINRFTMETKRQLDVLDKHLADKKYMIGDEYAIADMAVFSWYGQVVLGRAYKGSQEFLQVDSYTNLVRWAKEVDSRAAVKRGVTKEYKLMESEG
jgi:GST-like protein